MNTRNLLLIAATGLVMASCGNNNGENKEGTPAKDTTAAPPKAPFSVAAVSQSPDYAGASLAIGSVKAEKAGADSAKVNFEFIVKNYELGAQTADNGTKQCNNSDKGQHIHFIMDEGAYKALYEPKNSITLANNTEHYLMAFLSRSYHESVKSKGAAVVYHFKIDEKGNMKKLDDPKTPMVFYSRPKGDYLGKDITNVLFDFYVWNCELGDNGYKVKAHVANPDQHVDTTITVNKWQPWFLQNLGIGKCKVEVSLVDKDGKQAEGPCTSASREFNLANGEPMK